MRNRKLWIGIALVAGSVCAQAQSLNHPTPGTPRTRNGKPNMQAPAPRLADTDLLESFCENEKDAPRLLG